MADTGWLSPTSNGSRYSDATNPANAYSSNDLRASLDGFGDSGLYANGPNGLAQDYYNFSFNIPSGATIDGLEFSFEGYSDPNNENIIFGVFDLTNSSSDSGYYFRDNSTSFDSTESTKIIGGPTNDFSVSWDDSYFSNARFGLWVSNEDGAPFNTTVKYFDHIQVKVHYTETVPTASVAPVTATTAIPSVTPTWIDIQSAASASLTVAFTIPAVTAGVENQFNASVQPISLLVNVVSVSAVGTQVVSASVSPVLSTLSVPNVTPSYRYDLVASVAPVQLATSVQAVTALPIWVANVIPVGSSFSTISVTATYLLEWDMSSDESTSWDHLADVSSIWTMASDVSTSWSVQVVVTSLLYNADILYNEPTITYAGERSGSSDGWSDASSPSTTWTEQ